MITQTRVERYPQANGTVHVVERHVDDAGVEHMRMWFAGPKADIDAAVVARVPALEAELERELVVLKERQDERSVDEKILAYVKEQPVEVLKAEVKLTDDEVAALAKREAVAVKEAEAVIRG